MMRNLERMFVDMGSELLDRAGNKYGFDGSAAKRELLDVKLIMKEKEIKRKVEKKEQPKCALPFTCEVRDGDCLGVKFNHGLYTQCWNVVDREGLCKGCHKQGETNETGSPDLGLIGERLMKGSEWRDNKGRAPVHYTRVMKKQKLSQEDVMAEAKRFNLTVDEWHFVAPEVKRGRPKKEVSDTDSEKSSKRPRGRPKKAAKVVEVDATEDLFASLMQEASNTKVCSAGDEDAMSDISDVSEVIKIEKETVNVNKEEAKLQKQKDKEAAKLEKEAAKLEKEAAKVAAKVAAKLEKEKEKEAKAQAKKAEKDAKAQAKQDDKNKKQTEKDEVKAKKEKDMSAENAAQAAPILEEEEESEDEAVVVKKFTHKDVTYLKSSTNVLYDVKTQDPVGLWNESTQTIEECELDSDDEEEED